MLRILIFTISLLSLMHHTYGQQIQSGTYRYGLLEFEVQEEVDSNPELTSTIKSSMEDGLGLIVNAFQDSMFVSVVLDSLTNEIVSRNLYDLRTNQHYTFHEIDGTSYYSIADIDPNQFYRSGTLPYKVIKSGPSSKKLPSLDLIKLDISVKGKELYTTNLEVATNVDFAPYSQFSMSPFKTDSFVTAFTIPAKDIHVKIGVVDFQEGLTSPEWFDSSTEGYEDANWIESVTKTLSEDKPVEEASQGQGINQDIFMRLKADEYLKENSFGSSTGIIEKYNYNIDANGFLGMLSLHNSTNKSRYLISKQEEEILLFFEKYNLDSPTLLSTIKKFKKANPKWRKDAKWEALNWAVLQDQLSDKDVRTTFAKNLQQLKSFSPKEIRSFERFVAGEITIEHLLLQINGLFAVGNKAEVSLNDFDKVAEEFYAVLFAREFPNYRISRNGTSLTVQVNETDYALDLSKYRKYHYANNSSDILYKDTFKLDSRLFNALADVFDHIAFDNGFDFTYVVKKPENLIQSFRYFDQTVVIMEHCPELKLFNYDYYLKKESPGEFHSASWIPLAFEQKYWFYSKGVKFQNFFEGGLIPYLNFITKNTKKDFLKFVEEHQKSLQITDVELADITLAVNTRPYKSPYPILSLLGGSVLEFQEWHRSPFSPTITNDKNTFAEVYPELNKFLRGAFIATNFTHDQENQEVTFKYGNKEITIPAKRTAMLEEAWKLLNKENKTDRILYPQRQVNDSDKKYLFLTPDQKKSLEKILDITIQSISE